MSLRPTAATRRHEINDGVGVFVDRIRAERTIKKTKNLFSRFVHELLHKNNFCATFSIEHRTNLSFAADKVKVPKFNFGRKRFSCGASAGPNYKM